MVTCRGVATDDKWLLFGGWFSGSLSGFFFRNIIISGDFSGRGKPVIRVYFSGGGKPVISGYFSGGGKPVISGCFSGGG